MLHITIDEDAQRQKSSCKYCVNIVTRQNLENLSNVKYYENTVSGNLVLTCIQTDRATYRGALQDYKRA
jgi:hypothetical protein